MTGLVKLSDAVLFARSCSLRASGFGSFLAIFTTRPFSALKAVSWYRGLRQRDATESFTKYVTLTSKLGRNRSRFEKPFNQGGCSPEML